MTYTATVTIKFKLNTCTDVIIKDIEASSMQALRNKAYKVLEQNEANCLNSNSQMTIFKNDKYFATISL